MENKKNNWTFNFFEEYYKSGKFNEGLNHYFKLSITSSGYLFIPHVARYFNENVTMPHSSSSLLGDDSETELGESICFAITFYYVCLINYAINKFYGMEVLCDILKQSGLPLVSCGLGGIMSPHHAMTEADLIFVRASKNQKRAIALFNDTKTFMINELKKSIKFKETSDVFWQFIENEIEKFNFLPQSNI